MTSTQIHLILFTVLNLILFLNAGYIGLPRTSGLQAYLGYSLVLTCRYDGIDGNGQFLEWYRNGNNSVKNEKHGHYIVENSPKQSRLIIKIFVQADSEVNKWSVKTNKPGHEEPIECQFSRIPLEPSPQAIKTNRRHEKIDFSHGSIRRLQDEAINFICLIEPNQKLSDKMNRIIWEFSKDDQTYSPLPEGVTYINDDQIFLNQVKKEHRGYYRCTLNEVSFTVLLRVKDRLAALWPFLGILGIILLLVIIIVIFERRQKSTGKPATGDEEDHAHDPLVRSANKPSDKDNKKRAVKA